MIASSLAFVASDVLGPAVEAHIAKLTLFSQTRTGPESKPLEYVRVCFHLNLKLVAISHTQIHCHFHSFIVIQPSCDGPKSSGTSLNVSGHPLTYICISKKRILNLFESVRRVLNLK